ncbi:hypothetical protein N7523_005525 [Penicillium sp. IBT 18751x]|nr:hypothetical protein N7523_005889 [Penicillium sp. IBT 18751x]KAJ6117774.1 hypothetical protein N7523_005525 [Penicillium sp. IBT 18751x]
MAKHPARTIDAIGGHLEFINNLRRSAFHWVNILRTKVSETTDDTHKTNLIAKSIHTALVCEETFDAEILAPMFAALADVSISLQCYSVIWNGKNSLSKGPSSLYHRWQILSYRSHAILAERIVDAKTQD